MTGLLIPNNHIIKIIDTHKGLNQHSNILFDRTVELDNSVKLQIILNDNEWLKEFSTDVSLHSYSMLMDFIHIAL